MKKNISINISGIIFHIEEDAFDKLKAYLDGINRYFSTFDDNLEIIADIESRIAEIFLAKLSEDKQVITLADVESLIATMGTISDFQAAEDQTKDEDQQSKYEYSEEQSTSTGKNKRLYRDENRKIVGGVCAGVAHYFNIDALWIRLLFVLLLFGSGGTILLVYFIMWAVVPGNDQLPEDKKLKKMFRDSESKVLGGVASGVANYFGVDVVIIRLIFVLTTFIGGSGLIAYIVLWIILPEAKTFSDKVQMKGEPVTLSNIESNIKESLNVKPDEEENIFVKILLFPFRLIAMIIEGVTKALGPIFRLIVDFIRIATGAIIVFTGLMMLFALVVTLGVLIGVFSSNILFFGDFPFQEFNALPLDTITNGAPTFTFLAAFIAVAAPCLLVLLLGASIIAKRIVFSSTVGWTLFAGFFISLAILAINVPSIVFNFKEDGEYKVTQTFDTASKTTVLKLNDYDDNGLDMTSLEIRGYNGDVLKLEQVFEAQGKTRREADENAQMVDYKVEQQDSVLTFDANFTFKPKAIFRAQRLNMTLYVPYGSKFIMDRDLEEILRNTIYRSGYRVSDMGDNEWTFTTSGLECLTCESRSILREPQEPDAPAELDNDSVPAVYDKSYKEEMSFSAFDDISISGAYTITIEKSDDYKVLLDGASRYLDDLIIRQEGGRLDISYRNNRIKDFDFTRSDIEIVVLTPSVNHLEITGASKAYITNFEVDDLKIELNGACNLKADILVDDLEVEITGASTMNLIGKGRKLTADVTGASHLDADDYRVDRAILEATGVSSIKAYVLEEANIDESFISNIKLRGDARIISDRKRY